MTKLIDEFVGAIQSCHKVRIEFYSEDDRGFISRVCAPMDHGPWRRQPYGPWRLHFWDYNSDRGAHPLSLLPERITSLEIIDETFEPSDFVTWNTGATPWFTKRDWGNRS